jgi:hypothetical protein
VPISAYRGNIGCEGGGAPCRGDRVPYRPQPHTVRKKGAPKVTLTIQVRPSQLGSGETKGRSVSPGPGSSCFKQRAGRAQNMSRQTNMAACIWPLSRQTNTPLMFFFRSYLCFDLDDLVISDCNRNLSGAFSYCWTLKYLYFVISQTSGCCTNILHASSKIPSQCFA